MATNTPLLAGGRILDFVLPKPPPLLHTRSGNELYDRPHTPLNNGFTTPPSTPQGSPSKNKLPPGANDLPNVFDNAMKLVPGSPTRPSRQQLSPHSPNKGGWQVQEGNVDDNGIRQQYSTAPGSPIRKSNKENTPPGARSAKETSFTNQAALSRQEPYQTRDASEVTSRPRYNTQRGLTPEELEKLQLPKVKRLANVTQLCRQRFDPTNSSYFLLTTMQIFLTIILTSSAMCTTDRRGKLNFKPSTRLPRRHLPRSTRQSVINTWEENEQTYESVGLDCGKGISRFSLKWVKGATDKFIWRRRRTQKKFAR